MLLLVDLDGVVYRGPVPVPGVAAVLAHRAVAGDTILYCTNNSSRHRTAYLDTLARLGAPVTPDSIFTSARATALVLAPTEHARPTVMVLGEEGLRRELRDVGIRAVHPTPAGLATKPGAVVVGIDLRLTYARLSAAMQAVRRGAYFVATNRDPVYPQAEGFVPGAGSIVAALQTAAGRPPDIVVGKPETWLYDAALHRAGAKAHDAVVIGDNLLTDIPAAVRIGARSILMLTGVSTAADVHALHPAERPTRIAADAAALETALTELAAEG